MRWVFAVVAWAAFVSLADASPQLQLGIRGGSYNTLATPVWDKETIVTTLDQFTLVALAHDATNSQPIDTSEWYYLSIALSPQTASPASLGSFLFAGTTINVTGDMTYGTPPIAGALDSQDLQDHGVFPTYFYEVGFKFDPTQRQGDIDTMMSPTTPLTPTTASGKNLYYQEFAVDVSGLDSSVSLHFDLYHYIDSTMKNALPGYVNIDANAPFSHDAQSGPGGYDPKDPNSEGVVPEPASVAVWASLSCVAVIGLWRRKRTGTA